MFPFSITYKGRFKRSLREEELRESLSLLSKYVTNNKGQIISLSDQKLSFNVSIWGWNWEEFAQIEKGIFILTDTTIKFKFFMYRLFLAVAIMSILFGVFTHMLWLGAFSFVILGLGNFIFALIKYQRMLTEIVSTINQMTGKRDAANSIFIQ